MSNIKVMTENLANKIAAGEVVEKIYSVVKELVENSIDADSKNIKVELIDAGKKSIKVVDDGKGMDQTDAKMCFQRHATSKIYKDDDLFFINTLGFRGEALPSIASVSEVVLETYNGNESTMIHIKGGEILNTSIAPKRQGTSITVTNLFYNTPARLKYLKSENSELKNVVSFLEKLSLSYPDIKITLTNNGYKILSTTGSKDLLKTIHEIYGSNVSSKMIEISGSNDDYDISGYICKPEITRSTRNQMITIINGRTIRNAEINKWINEAYYTYKPDSVYPIVVINIDTDPTLIDVNIHPTKQDIKISKMDELKEILISTIKEALKRELLIKDVKISEDESLPLVSKLPKTLFIEENDEIKDYTLKSFENPLSEIKEEQSKFEFLENEDNIQIKKLNLYPVGIAFGTYIIAENEEGIYLIDQHAAQERVNYEKVLKGLLNNEKTEMLVPITIELPLSDFIVIKNNSEKLKNMGFELEEFGINTFKINAHPIWIKEGFEKDIIKKVFDGIIEFQNNFDPVRFNDKIAATIACKKSVKGNTRITLDEAKFIIKELVLCDNPYNCPHGRPTIIKFTIYELEKMFKRVM